MKETIIILLFLIVPFIGINQNDTLNQLDENNLRKGYWINYAEDNTNSNDTIGVKAEEGRYANDCKVGVWIKYYPDGETIKLKGEYVNGKPNGSFTKFYKNGAIKIQGNFRNKHLFGIYKVFYENGTLKQLTNYNDFEIQLDTSYYFNPAGKIELLSIFDTLNKIRTDIFYNKDGTHNKTSIKVSEKSYPFSLLQTLNEPPSDSNNFLVGTYYYKITFNDTPIFREYLLTIYQDSTFKLSKYVYESCYNYIKKSSGTWSINNEYIYFNIIKGDNMISELIIGDNELYGKPIIEIDNKIRTYHLKKILP